MSEDQAATVEITMVEARKMVERREKLNKLFSNREFRSLILEGYMKDEPARLAKLMGDSTNARLRDEIVLELTAIGKFDEFMRTIVALGNQAEETLQDHADYLNDIEAAMADAGEVA